jgi:diaminohydroxyphosphoribosylaminopyrimidine deaminase/5-amino-6-(5-phosphoribosylamino)uracil reductase
VEGRLQPLRVVVDSHLQLPDGARVLAPPGRVLVATTADDPLRCAALIGCGADVIVLPSEGGKVDLAALLAELARRDINEVHVEAGNKLNASLLKAGLVDELLVYMAPMLIGHGREMAPLGPFDALSQAPRLELRDVSRIGDDLRLRLLTIRPGPT